LKQNVKIRFSQCLASYRRHAVVSVHTRIPRTFY